ncbi:MAG: ABC transporter ATP-binding protein, partial [Acidobacteria bacterium]|nr:ABC transporter ATP-binding protein [Acidobacteriota bacterium]
MAILFKIRNLVKRFGGLVAVNEFNFEVEQGRIVSIIGPNGAGKTTVFNCITGFYSVDEGTIEYAGHLLNGRSTDRITRLGISRTYQNIRLFANMTAFENILVGMEPHLKSTFLGTILRTPAMRKEEREAGIEAQRLLGFVGLESN